MRNCRVLRITGVQRFRGCFEAKRARFGNIRAQKML